MAVTENEVARPSGDQAMFWQELTQLKLEVCYVRDYRNSMGKLVTGFAAMRAITSSVSIGAWAVWRKYALIWAAIIAASQVADALRNVFPFRKKRQALSRWSHALNRCFVLAQRDWADISAGRFTDAKIRRLSHEIRLKKQGFEAKYIPDGLPLNEDLFEKAEKEMVSFFKARYPSIED